jgi:hypothetical protein
VNEITISSLIAGLILLFLGRKLFWFFVAVVGFIAGLSIAPHLFNGPGWILLLIALIGGAIGAVLALLLQRFAVGVAGFFVGGYLANTLLLGFHIDPGSFAWLAFIVGGLIGSILLTVLFDWALILLSSLLRATLITQSLPLNPSFVMVLWIILLIIGFVFQAVTKQRESGVKIPTNVTDG